MRTPVLVLDEPTTGQDARGVERVRGIVEAAAPPRDAPSIAISHDMRFVAETFERVVVMRDGRVILDGTPADVFAADRGRHLRSTYLEPPLAAVIGDRLGLGSTPTDASLVEALRARDGSARPNDRRLVSSRAVAAAGCHRRRIARPAPARPGARAPRSGPGSAAP